MTDELQKNETKKDKMCFFDYAVEVVGWLEIVASPLSAGLIIGAIIYFSNPTTWRLIIAISIATLGLIVGIIFATRIWKKQGTMHFLSRIMASPELDNLDEVKK
jgi:amino acid transporter